MIKAVGQATREDDFGKEAATMKTTTAGRL